MLLPPSLPSTFYAGLTPAEQDVFRISFGSSLAGGKDAHGAEVDARRALTALRTRQLVVRSGDAAAGDAVVVALLSKAFNPDQPRDDDGKWTSVGEWSSSGGVGKLKGTGPSSIPSVELEEYIASNEVEMEEINDESMMIDAPGREADRLRVKYSAREAINTVMRNDIRAKKRPEISGNEKFRYESGMGGKITSAIHYRQSGDSVSIEWLGSTRAGEGGMLLAAAEADALKIGAKSIKLNAKWGSEKYYEAKGYKRTGESNPLADWIGMEKPLAGAVKAFNPDQPRDKDGKWTRAGLISEGERRLKELHRLRGTLAGGDVLYSLAAPLRRSEAALDQIEHVANASTFESMERALESQSKWQGSWVSAHDEWQAAAVLGGNGQMSKATSEDLAEATRGDGAYRFRDPLSKLSSSDIAAFEARRSWMQKKFREEYGESLTVYRGVSGRYASKLPMSGTADIPSYALSSWTDNSYTAQEFAKKKGRVLKMTITADDIWLLPRRGVESVIRVADARHEFVVLNKNKTRRVEVL